MGYFPISRIYRSITIDLRNYPWGGGPAQESKYIFLRRLRQRKKKASREFSKGELAHHYSFAREGGVTAAAGWTAPRSPFFEANLC